MSEKKVFIILQDNEDARPIIEAIEADNPDAVIQRQPGMVRIEAISSLRINQSTVEENCGREWDVQEIHLSLVSLGGNVDEDDDYFSLHW